MRKMTIVVLIRTPLYDRASGFVDRAVSTTTHNLYSDLFSNLLHLKTILKAEPFADTTAGASITKLKRHSKQLFGDIDEFNLFIIKFHTFYHVKSDFQRLDDARLFDQALSEHFITTIKRCIRMNLMRCGSALKDVICSTNNLFADDKENSTNPHKKTNSAAFQGWHEKKSWRHFLNKRKGYFDVVRDFRNVPVSLFIETIQVDFNLTSDVPLSSDVVLKVMEFEFTRGVIDVTLHLFDSNTNFIDKNFLFSDCTIIVYPNSMFGLSNTKPFFAILVK